jgi:endoplasmic reticulum junction formation protein lunapark
VISLFLAVLWRYLSGLQKFYTFVLFIILSFFLYFLHLLMRMYYARRLNSCEAEIEKLRETAQDQLEKLRNDPTYLKTQAILSRYDNPRMGSPEPKKMPAAMKAAPSEQGKGRERENENKKEKEEESEMDKASAAGDVVQDRNPAVQHVPFVPRTPIRGQQSLLDRLTEWLIGDGPGKRRALHCQYCWAHNGLAPADQAESLRWKCGNCGEANGDIKSGELVPTTPRKATATLAQMNVDDDEVNAAKVDADADANADDYDDENTVESVAQVSSVRRRNVATPKAERSQKVVSPSPSGGGGGKRKSARNSPSVFA